MSHRPRASIIIPTYNRRVLLEESLTRLLLEIESDVEVVVVDDGSTDSTSAYLSSLSSRITFVRQENCGAARARNVGLAHATGELVKFLDSDDLLSVENLYLQVQHLEENPTFAGCFSDWKEVDIESCEERRVTPFPTNPDSIASYISPRLKIASFALLVRKRVLPDSPWDETIFRNQENDYVLRIVRSKQYLSYLPGVAGSYRHHPGARFRNTGEIHGNVEKLKVFKNTEEYLEEMALSDVDLRRLFGKVYRVLIDRLYILDKSVYNQALNAYLGNRPKKHIYNRRLSACVAHLVGFKMERVLRQVVYPKLHAKLRFLRWEVTRARKGDGD